MKLAGFESKESELRLFWYWMQERHNIYIRRHILNEPWPWTDDQIFQTYKFTNVFRELDTGTIWLRENWREPYADDPELFFNICLYRQFNWWPTAEFLGYQIEWDADKQEQRLRERSKDEKIFTGAHMLTGTLGGPERKDKIWQVCHPVLEHLWDHIEDYEPVPGDKLQTAFERIKDAPGFGPFLAYEVVTDLRHTRFLREAEDIYTWANPGPGAKRGLARLWGHKVGWDRDADGNRGTYNYPPSGRDYVQAMRDLYEAAPKEWQRTKYSTFTLEMRDIEHSLCEFDKYARVYYGEGRPRSKYTPPHQR